MPNCKKLLGGGIDIGTEIENVDMAVDRWKRGDDCGTVDAGQSLEHESCGRHECTGIAGGHNRLRLAAFHEIDGNTHR